MFRRMLVTLAVPLCLTLCLSACGSKTSAPENTATVAPLASPMSEYQRETNALPLGQMAAVPSSLHCAGAIVWANMARKTYHLSGDPYYGRTKHGEYMCEAAANAQGYHKAGARHHTRGPKDRSMMRDMTPQPSYT